MQLILLDVDGTLLRTMGKATSCFARALEEVTKAPLFSRDWSAYRHATDEGIALEAVERKHGRAPHGHEMQEVRDRYLRYLHELLSSPASPLVVTPGAPHAVEELERRGFAIALATGGWQSHQRLKLEFAGISTSHLPGGFAEDALSREDITRAAVRYAHEHFGCAEFERVVYLGDAEWDARSCANLRMNMLGIGASSFAEKLKASGVKTVIPDYSDMDRFLRALDEATVPASCAAG